MRGFQPSTVSGGKSVPRLRGMYDCDVFPLRASDQHMVYFMGTLLSVVIAIFGLFSTQRTLSKMPNVAINPLKTVEFCLCHMARGGKEERER